MNNHFRKDRTFGATNEQKVLDYINKNTIDKFIKTKDRYCYYDFENTNYICELKSRRNSYRAYPTTMVSQSKIDKSETNNKKLLFLFLFTDGLYSYKYKSDDDLKLGLGGRNDRINKEINKYCFIPIKLLSLITTDINSI